MKKILLMISSMLAAAFLLTACSLLPAQTEAAAAPTQTEAIAAPTQEVATTAQGEATATPADTEGTEPAETATDDADADTLEFSLTTLTEETLDQTVFSENKLIMVNYWATWCGPCVSEIPDLVKISKDYADKDFVIIGVLTGDDDIDGAKQFIADQGVTYPVVLPEDFFLDQADGMYAIPTTMFFDAEGNQVGETVVGSKSYEDWAGLIDLLLGQVS